MKNFCRSIVREREKTEFQNMEIRTYHFQGRFDDGDVVVVCD